MAANPHTDTPRPAARAGGSLAEQVLTRAQAGRDVVQEFVPLAWSLAWELGQPSLRERGNKAFLSDASPHRGCSGGFWSSSGLLPVGHP